MRWAGSLGSVYSWSMLHGVLATLGLRLRNSITQQESKHADELQIATNEHNEQLDTLHTILSLQLREKYMFEKQIMLIKEQLEEGSEEAKQFVYEVKFMLVLMSMLSVLISQRMEYFVYVSPLYFLFIFFTLEWTTGVQL